MIGYEDVIGEEFHALETAAEGWERTAAGFEEAEADHRSHVFHATSGNAQVWSGLSADAATDRFEATERELAAAQLECKGIARLLRDGRSELLRLRDRVMQLAAEAEEAGFTVNRVGWVSLVDRQPNDPETARLAEVAAQWRLEIDRAVSLVAAADLNLRQDLREAVSGLDVMGSSIFNGAALAFADIPPGQEAAELAARLTDEGELSDQEWFDLNRLLATHANDPAFNRLLLTELGADGLLALSAQVAGRLGDGGDEETRQRYATLEQRLANAVSVATQTPAREGGVPYGQWVHTEEGLFYESWMSDLRQAGTERYAAPGLTSEQVTGYQLLTTVLSSGDGYADLFLQDLADGIRTAEDPSRGGRPDIWRLRMDTGNWEGLSENELSRFTVDPLNAVLNIMAGSPDASASYLDPERNDNLDYLLNDRAWTHLSLEMVTSQGIHQSPVETSRDGMANALEAATTGRPAGTDTPPADLALNRTEAGARVMEHVVTTFAADNGAAITDDGDWAFMRPELGRMAAAYMGDLQEILGDSVGVLDPPEPLADFSPSGAAAFLSQVGRDPDAHGYISAAQQAYTAMAVDYVLCSPTDERFTVTERVEHAVWSGSIIAGILTEARVTAVYEDGIASDEDFNRCLDAWVEFSGLVLDEAVSKVTDRIPHGAAFVEWGVAELFDAGTEALRRDSSQESADNANDVYEELYQEALLSAKRAVTVAGGDDFDEQGLHHLHNSVATSYRVGFEQRIGWSPDPEED